MDDGGGHPYAYELHPPQPTLKYAEQSLTQQPDFPQFVQLMSAAVLGSLSTVVLDSPSCACIQIKMVWALATVSVNQRGDTHTHTEAVYLWQRSPKEQRGAYSAMLNDNDMATGLRHRLISGREKKGEEEEEVAVEE